MTNPLKKYRIEALMTDDQLAIRYVVSNRFVSPDTFRRLYNKTVNMINIIDEMNEES